MFNKRLIELGCAVHCKSKEEVEEILKEMNWVYRKSFIENVKDNNWDVYIFSCDYDIDGWSAEFDGDEFTQKLEFEEFKKSPIALYLGVEENKEFKMRYNGHEKHIVYCKIEDGKFYYKTKSSAWLEGIDVNWFLNSEVIKESVFSDKTKAEIKAAITLGVEKVKRFKIGINHMVILKFKKGEEITISGEYYFEDFEDGEEYILEDIIKDDEIYYDAR